MRRAVLAALLVMSQPALGDYVLKWTLPVSLNPFNDALSDSRANYAGTAVLDVNTNGTQDFMAIGVPGDDSAIVLVDGSDDQPVWRIPYPENYRYGSCNLSTVSNLDGDGDTCLIVCFRRGVGLDSSLRHRSCLDVYGCADHSLTLRVPETPSGCLPQAGPCPDLDGDGLPEIAWYFSSDSDPYAGVGVCRIYGWEESPPVDSSPRGSPHLPRDFPLEHPDPSPDH